MFSLSWLALKRLSWRTRLIAASSLLGANLVWKTTPKEPFPTILHWVYCISLVSPVTPSWTFSWTTSTRAVSAGSRGDEDIQSVLTTHAKAINAHATVLGRHLGEANLVSTFNAIENMEDS